MSPYEQRFLATPRRSPNGRRDRPESPGPRFITVPSPMTSSGEELQLSPTHIAQPPIPDAGEAPREEEMPPHTVPSRDITMEEPPSFIDDIFQEDLDMTEVDMTEPVPGLLPPSEQPSVPPLPEPITSQPLDIFAVPPIPAPDITDVPPPPPIFPLPVADFPLRPIPPILPPITASPRKGKGKEMSRSPPVRAEDTPAIRIRSPPPTPESPSHRRRDRRRARSDTSSEFELGAAVPVPRRRPSRRRLILDENTSIGRGQIRNWIQTANRTLTRPLEYANVHPRTSPEVLFRQPGRRCLADPLLKFWKRIRTIPEPRDPTPYGKYGLQSDMSSDETGSLSTELLSAHLSVDEVEIEREISMTTDSALQMTGPRTPLDKSEPSVKTSHEAVSHMVLPGIEEVEEYVPQLDVGFSDIGEPAPEQQPIGEVPGQQPIPEVPEQQPFEDVPQQLPRPKAKRPCKLRTPSPSTSPVSTLTPPVSPKPTLENVLQMVFSASLKPNRTRPITFRELAPPERENRFYAATVFKNLLKLQAERYLTLQQRIHYGEIFIYLCEDE